MERKKPELTIGGTAKMITPVLKNIGKMVL